jgi:DNA-binding GntR family transcriptional regulator
VRQIDALGLGSTLTQEEFAAAWLNRSILAGDLPPGTRLGQDDIAKRIGMSLIPVREALRRLVGDGQLTYIPRKGYMVAELTARDMRDIYDLRGLLEDHILIGSVSPVVRADVPLLSRISQKCAEAFAGGDVMSASLGQTEFFRALFMEERNQRAVGLIRQLWQATNAYAPLYYRTDEGRQGAETGRTLIMAALELGDEEAMLVAVREHRARALGVLMRFAKDTPAPGEPRPS